MRARQQVRQRAHRFAGDAALVDQPVPRLRRERLGERLEALGVAVDERVIDSVAAAARVLVEQLLHHALQQRDVAADAHGQEHAGDRRAAAQHLQRMLRVREARQRDLGQRVDR